jgi:hypothetical protein
MLDSLYSLLREKNFINGDLLVKSKDTPFTRKLNNNLSVSTWDVTIISNYARDNRLKFLKWMESSYKIQSGNEFIVYKSDNVDVQFKNNKSLILMGVFPTSVGVIEVSDLIEQFDISFEIDYIIEVT